jgi:hypothetical protein
LISYLGSGEYRERYLGVKIPPTNLEVRHLEQARGFADALADVAVGAVIVRGSATMSSTHANSPGSRQASLWAVGVPLGGAAAVGRRTRWLGAAGVTVAVMAILALAGVSVVAAATSDHVEHPTATALFYGYLVAAPFLVGLYWVLRRPQSPFGRLLVAFGMSTWLVSWQSSDWPLAFDIGVLAEAVVFVMTFYLLLAFPSGRLKTLGNRLLVSAAAAPVLFFVPWALLTPAIAGGSALSGCRPACPANVLQVGSNPGAVEFLGRWEGYAMLALSSSFSASTGGASPPPRGRSGER